MENIHERLLKVLEFKKESVKDIIPFLDLKEGEYEFTLAGVNDMFVPTIMVKFKNDDVMHNTGITLEWLVDNERSMKS